MGWTRLNGLGQTARTLHTTSQEITAMENTHRSPEATTPRFRFGVAKFGSRRHSAWTIAGSKTGV